MHCTLFFFSSINNSSYLSSRSEGILFHKPMQGEPSFLVLIAIILTIIDNGKYPLFILCNYTCQRNTLFTVAKNDDFLVSIWLNIQ